MKRITLFLMLMISSLVFSQNLLMNGDFSNGSTSWALDGGGSVVAGEAYFATSNAAGNPWDTQLAQHGFAFAGGTSYTLTFKARAAANRNVVVAIQNFGIWNEQTPNVTHALTTTMQTFTQTFTAASTNADVNLAFLLGVQGSTDAVYIDDVVLSTTPVNPAADASLSDLKVNGTTVAGFNSGVLTYDLESPASPVPTVTAMATQATAQVSVTQATSVPGSATVTVTAPDMMTTKTYTVNFTLPVGPQVSASNPTHPDSDVVLSLFNDKPGYTNAYAAEGEFGTRTLVSLDAENDQTIKMDFSVAGWGQYDNTPPSVATAGYLHFSYYAPNVAPGANGHGFFIMLNSGSGEKYFTVKPTGGDATMVFDSWQTVSIPMSHFTSQGFNPASVLSWKLGTDSDLNTKLVWFDNIFFTQGVLGTTEAKGKSDVKTYPNPAKAGEPVFFSSEMANVEVFSAAGQVVRKTNAKSLDTTGLESGLYILKMTNKENQTSSTKLIVK